MYAFGNNFFGNLGNGESTAGITFQQVDTSYLPNVTWKSVSIGQDHFIFLSHEGRAYTLGGNVFGMNIQIFLFYMLGQCGDGSSSTRTRIGPVDTRGVLANKTIVQVAASQISSMVLTSDGDVVAWGHNGTLRLQVMLFLGFNQLCDGTSENRYLPIAVNTSITGGFKVVSIAYSTLR